MLLLLFAYILNILLVTLKKYTKMRAIFTTGNVQVQQAATALWLIMFCFPQLASTPALVVMTLLLGLYWAVGSNLTMDRPRSSPKALVLHWSPADVWYLFASKAAGWMARRDAKRRAAHPGKESVFDKKLEDIELLVGCPCLMIIWCPQLS
jgi:PTS system ascorbate-specific IIC component